MRATHTPMPSPPASSMLATAGALAVLLLGIAALPAMAAGKLYKWTDAEGVTHYTDSPPPESEEFEMREIDVPPAPPAVAAMPPEGAGTAPVALPASPCGQLQANLATLRDAANVRMDIDGDGVAEPLDEEARLAQLQATEEQLASDCTGAAADAAAMAEGGGAQPGASAGTQPTPAAGQAGTAPASEPAGDDSAGG